MNALQAELSASQLARLQDSSLFNADLAPVPPQGRKWRVWSFAALWISMSACIPTYMLASSLIGGGMNWWQAVLTIFLGNLIVLIPMVLNAHAGTHYGIPFPVYCRASFGTRGANVPALLRALVACGWFGIQTWIGGEAIYKILAVFIPALASGTPSGLFGITLPQLVCFLFFWGINMLVVYQGIDSIRLLLNIKAPLLIALGLAAAGLGLSQRGRVRADALPALAVRSRPAQERAVLGLLLPRADRHDRLLGHALAQHPRLLPLCLLPARPGPRPGARPAADDGALLVHRRGGHLGDHDHLRPDHLGPGGRADPLQQPRGARRRDGRALPGDAGDQHRRQRRQPGQRLRPPLPAAHLIPDRRADHRARRHPDAALEAGRRPHRLHLYAGWSPTAACWGRSAAS